MLEAFGKAEKHKKPKPTELFYDVYKEVPKHLERQMDEMKKHVAEYKDVYQLNNYEQFWERTTVLKYSLISGIARNIICGEGGGYKS